MKTIDDTRPIEHLKAHACELLDQVNRTRRPVVITQDGKPRGVLQDPGSYESMHRALAILKLMAEGESDIRRGRSKPQEEVFASMEAAVNIDRHG